ncbi:hypothetical protein K440DRAFT_628282 [Wilcoxina mikolae CBS 423.85]|nr:hypothetical protein K440DRAFT_628282 [Wilcoxina mikolae CBS 423.85]
MGPIAWALSFRQSCSPLGKQHPAVGRITATYEKPSATIPFPWGYQHDLSLISAPTLPTMYPPPNLLIVHQFADPKGALARELPVFTARFNVQYTRHDVYEGRVLPESVQEDLVTAAQYTWETESRRVSRSLLWRTLPQDDISVQSASGSVLCIGHPGASTARAVVFQNFQSVFSRDVAGRHVLQLETAGLVADHLTTFKRGFLMSKMRR